MFVLTMAAVMTASLVSNAAGSCFHGFPSTATTRSGATIMYCEHNQMRFLPGTTVNLLDDCLTCSCSNSSFHCCGIGINAGVMATPPGCKLIRDRPGCNPNLVSANDESSPCHPV